MDGLSSGRLLLVLLPPQTNAVSESFLFHCPCGRVNYRQSHHRDDDDYDIDFYTADPTLQENDPEKPSPRDQLEVSQTCSFLAGFDSSNHSFWLVIRLF